MASTLPTPLEDCCSAQESGCCTADCVTVTVGGSAANPMSFNDDPNTLGIVPDDPTKVTLGIQYTTDYLTFVALWTWNPLASPPVWQ